MRKTRNALTHGFFKIRQSRELEDEENMTEETLVKHILKLAGTVRNAILNLLVFVLFEEGKKSKL